MSVIELEVEFLRGQRLAAFPTRPVNPESRLASLREEVEVPNDMNGKWRSEVRRVAVKWFTGGVVLSTSISARQMSG